jgi:hypothetical protein
MTTIIAKNSNPKITPTGIYHGCNNKNKVKVKNKKNVDYWFQKCKSMKAWRLEMV